MRGGWSPGRAAWTTAGAVSLAAHLVLLGSAIWLLGREAPLREAPALSVQLVTLAPRRAPEVEAEPDNSAPPRTPARVPPRMSAAAPPDVAAPLPPEQTDPAAGVARVLRGRLGCRSGDLSRLSAEERERCRAVLADAGAARDAPAPRLDLSRQGRITEDPDFDLSRRPKNGCKVRAAGSRDPMGKEGAAAGIACGWSF